MTGGRLLELMSLHGDAYQDYVKRNPENQMYKVSKPSLSSIEPTCDMSFTGLSTSTEKYLGTPLNFEELVNLSSSYQKAMFSHVLSQTHRAVEHVESKYNLKKLRAINICGGVSCNLKLYERINALKDVYPHLEITRSSPEFCTDNAAMIAWMGWELINQDMNLDLRHLVHHIQPQTVMPVGGFSEERVKVNYKTLREMRKRSRQ